MARLCSIDGCDKPDRTRGYCKSHYSQLRRRGLLWATDKRCAVPGCRGVHEAKGYCRRHYRELAAPRRGTCSVAGCGKAVNARGLCDKHYLRLREGRPLVDREAFAQAHPPEGGVGLVPVWTRRGLVTATVDEAAYARAIRHRWWTSTVAGVVYPVADIDGKEVRLGQFVLGLTGRRRVMYFDHNALNCRRSNIAACDYSQMLANARTSTKVRKTSKYRGVFFNRRARLYHAYVGHKGKTHGLGYFRDEVAAALARDEKARELYGPFARLNFPDA